MRNLLILATSLLLAACGGGGGSDAPSPPAGPPPPPPLAVTKAEAYQLLNQATFGATEAEADRVIALGIEGWIDDQLAKPPSRHLPYVQAQELPEFIGQLNAERLSIWFDRAVHADDQLRQRVAFALSEIMVVSQVGVLNAYPYALAGYYDVLAVNAFGNYRDLIEDVTLHPAMGIYLSMLGNEKPNPVLNIRPDENYARELMQLFSIGLVELRPDGTVVTDLDGVPVPTYDQSIIEGFAHVFTGWTFTGARSFRQARPTRLNQVLPMELYPDFHDTGSKKLLNGIVLAPDQPGEQDLADALDNIFAHDNVGPFIAVRLIQRLVTSNPSPWYVARVASVFDDNGMGERGDLGAVVKAILMDPEARPDMPMEIDGKLKEPLLRLTQLWRAYDAEAANGKYLLYPSFFLGQGPLQSPSVFNFFSPFYAPPGEIRNSSLVAPELEIATEFQNTMVTNFFFFQVFGLNSASTDLDEDDIYIDLDEEIALAADIDALIDRVDEKLLAGQMSDPLREQMVNMLGRLGPDDTVLRAAEAVYLTVTSPEYAYQR